MTSAKRLSTEFQGLRVLISLVSNYYPTVSSWTLMESQKFMSDTEQG